MGHNVEISFVPLMVVIGLAFLVPLLLSRIKFIFVPIVVGEIVAGMIVGRSGLGLVRDDSLLELLSVLGFAFLMFLSGLEIDFKGVSGGDEEDASRLRRMIGNPLVLASTLFALTLFGSLGAAFLLQSQGLIDDPWIMALILSTTSVGVVVPVLKEQGLTGGRYGQTIVMSAMVADFSTILLISSYAVLYRQGLSLNLLLVLVLLAAFIVVYRLGVFLERRLSAIRVIAELSSATAQLGLRGSFALALVFIALARSLGVELILGAFLAGVIVSFLLGEEGSILREKLDAIGYGFFIPIFFIMVGARFDLPALLSSRSALLLVPLLLGFAYAAKFVPALVLRLRFSWRETLAAGALLSARLSLIIAAAAIGLELGLISEAINSAVILIAVLTCTISPVLFNRLVPEHEERDRIIVVGSQTSAGLLARRLHEHEFDVTLINDDNSEDQRSYVLRDSPVDSDQALSETLQRARIDRARTVVAVGKRDADNLRICRMAREKYGIENLIAWVQNPAHNGGFRALGVRVLNPAYNAVLTLESMVLHPGAFSSTTDVDEMLEVREVELRNSELVGQPLNELALPGDAVVLMIERDGGAVVPDQVPGTEIKMQAGDVVTLAGNADEVDDTSRLFTREPDDR